MRKLFTFIAAVAMCALLVVVIKSSYAQAGDKSGIRKQFIDLNVVDFSPNERASARILISEFIPPENNPHPADWWGTQPHVVWDIAVEGLHCNGNHQVPGDETWKPRASYALYVNGVRLNTFSIGCTVVSAFGHFRTDLHIFRDLGFDPFLDPVIAEIVHEIDDGFDACAPPSCAGLVMLRGES